jgi:predicted RND superfamily exporter protein
MKRLFRFIAGHAWLVLGLHAAILLGVLFAIVDPVAPGLRLRIETSVEKILPTEGPTRDRYKQFRETFGNDELLVVGVKTDDLFTRTNLERIATLTEHFSKAPGVRQVVSLSTAPGLRSVDGQVEVRNALDELPETPEQLQALGAIGGLGGILYVVCGLWMLVTMVGAVRQGLDYPSTGRAIAVCAIGFPIYVVILVATLLLTGPWPV